MKKPSTHPFVKLLCLCVLLGCAVRPAFAVPPVDWTGPYIGVHIGGIWSDFSDRAAPGPAGDDENIMGGGQIGMNWQFDRLVLGLEGDFSKFNTNSSTTFGMEQDWMSTIRARAGYAVGRVLPYVTGGLALTDTIKSVPGVGRDSSVRPGFTAGAGLEGVITETWLGRNTNLLSSQLVTARIEYFYVDVPEETSTIGATPVTADASNHTVRFGMNFKF